MPAIRSTMLTVAIGLAAASPVLARDAMGTSAPPMVETMPDGATSAPHKAFLETAARIMASCSMAPAGIIPCAIPAGAMAGAAMVTMPSLSGTR